MGIFGFAVSGLLANDPAGVWAGPLLYRAPLEGVEAVFRGLFLTFSALVSAFSRLRRFRFSF